MFGVKFISSTSSSNWPPELGHRPSLRPTPVSPSNANRKLQHNRAQRPTGRALERDEDAIRQWKQQRWPALKKSPKRRPHDRLHRRKRIESAPASMQGQIVLEYLPAYAP